MKSKKADYLKYWRVIRYYVKSKYNLTQADLDILLFLYSEKYFTRAQFKEFDNLLSWDKKRFDSLLARGWIETFRKNIGRQRAIYCLGYPATRMIQSIYNKLNGEEIPELTSDSPMFRKNVAYSDKVYRNMIKKMNTFVRSKDPSDLID